MDKIKFPYRSSSHLTLLHVVAQSGSWEKHGLDVEYDVPISKGDAHRAVDKGEVDFVSGNHISTYGKRTHGDDWVYIGQTVNSYKTSLCVRPDSGIESLADLKGKKIGSVGAHPGLNDWLFLKQHGLDVDRDDFEFVKEVDGAVSNRGPLDEEMPSAGGKKKRRVPHWHWIRDGHVDAALITRPASMFAEAAGLKLIEVDDLPMIWFTTVSTNLRFVRKHPDLVHRFLKGLIEGIAFFKTQREKSIKILQDRYTTEGQMTWEQAAFLWETIESNLEPKLYPTMAAISNVYEEAKRQDPEAAKINPLTLWDLDQIRHIDDSGFVDGLYRSGRNEPTTIDPEEAKDKAAERNRIIEAVKACGHLASVDCGCDA